MERKILFILGPKNEQLKLIERLCLPLSPDIRIAYGATNNPHRGYLRVRSTGTVATRAIDKSGGQINSLNPGEIAISVDCKIEMFPLKITKEIKTGYGKFPAVSTIRTTALGQVLDVILQLSSPEALQAMGIYADEDPNAPGEANSFYENSDGAVCYHLRGGRILHIPAAFINLARKVTDIA